MATRAKVASQAVPRATANLTLSFGLVSIDVQMKPLCENPRKGIGGRMLCPEHMAPLGMRFLCEEGDHYLTKGETITGYETAPKSGEYVVLDADVLEELVEERTGDMELVRFAPLSTVPSSYLEKQYLCWPGEKAGEQFDLVCEILKTQKVAALARGVLTKKTRLVAFIWDTHLDALIAYPCVFDSDVRWSDVELVQQGRAKRGDPKKAYLEVAKPLVSSLDGNFDPSDVEDEYRPAFLAAIEAAAAGRKPKARKAAKQAGASGDDLMAALKASVEEAGSKPKAKPRAKAAAGR